MWGDIAIAFLLAFITAFVVTPYTIKLAKKVGAIDLPKDERRINKKPMPRLGGLAVIAGFLVSIIYLIAILGIEGSLSLNNEQQYYMKLIGFFLGALVITITCFIDDVKGLPALVKLGAQIIAAIIAIKSGIIIQHISIPFFDGEGLTKLNEVFSIILTLGWIVGITNAINLIDGLDGLSSGTCAIFYLTIGIIAFIKGGVNSLSITLAFIMLGSTLGFLYHNFYPAKIFSGDSGSMFQGFMIATICLLGFKTTAFISFFVPILILGIPILDTLFAIVRRSLKHQKIYLPDKCHLHHQLLSCFCFHIYQLMCLLLVVLLCFLPIL